MVDSSELSRADPPPFCAFGARAFATLDNKGNGGEGGIRTPDTLPGMPVFKTGAINRSATSPEL